MGGFLVSEPASEQLPVRPWGWVDVLALILLMLLSAALACSSFGRRDLWHPDETRFAVVARTMHDTGNYLVPHLGPTLYEEKPPMLFWLMNLSAKLTGGFSDVAIRLPSAAASVLTAMAFYLIARLFFGRLTSFFAVVVLQTNLLFLLTAQFAITDRPLMCFQAWALYCFLRGEYASGEGWCRGWGWYAAFFVLCAGASLVKGPVGLLVPAAVVVVWMVAGWRFYSVKRAASVLVFILVLGPALYLALVAAWLVPAVLQAGKPYLEYLLLNLTFWRITGPKYLHRPWFYYLWTFFLYFWPWSFYAPEALVRAFLRWWRDKEETPARRRLSEGLLLVLLWFIVVIAGWSVGGVKRVRYVMFGYFAASLAVGWLWAGLVTRRERWTWATTGATVLVLMTVLAMGGAGLVLSIPGLGEWTLAHAPLDRSVPASEFGAGLTGWHLASLFFAVSLVVVAGGLVWSLARHRRWVGVWVFLVPIALQVNAAAWVFPMLNSYRSMRALAVICQDIRAQHPQAAIALCDLSWTGTAWYARDTNFLTPAGPKDILALLDQKGETFVLGEASYLESSFADEPRFREFPREEKKAGIRRILILRNASGGGSTSRGLLAPYPQDQPPATRTFSKGPEPAKRGRRA